FFYGNEQSSKLAPADEVVYRRGAGRNAAGVLAELEAGPRDHGRGHRFGVSVRYLLCHCGQHCECDYQPDHRHIQPSLDESCQTRISKMRTRWKSIRALARKKSIPKAPKATTACTA